MKTVLIAAGFLIAVSAAHSQQTSTQTYSDPLALLQAVAKNYGAAVDTFHIEAITDNVSGGELRHDWSRTYRTAIKGPRNLYRIEIRNDFGSYTQVSDGDQEWVYQVESNSYVKRPVPEDWPTFPRVMDMGHHELKQTWEQRTWLEEDALGYKRAAMLPDETIVVEGRHYPCYVVQVSSLDGISHQKEGGHWETTFWIDKKDLVFRKRRQITDSFSVISNKLRVPYHGETTDLYPVVEFNPQTSPETFRFAPPADAKEVASLDPDFGRPPPSGHPKAQMVGQPAPEVTLVSTDGKKVALSSYRGKPVLIDFWATWCGPCLLSMPSIGRIYADAKDRGLAVVSVDENGQAGDGPVYFERHHYGWANFHDEDKAVQTAFKGEGIPLVVLVDAQGKIVYYDFGGDEAALRRAIASLGPEFASLAPASSSEKARKN